jgi:hypothetical protein
MKKVLVWGLGGLVVLGVVGLVLLYAFLGRIVKKGIEVAGPAVTKCPVTVDRVEVRPLRGKLRIVNLTIGNPEGFKTPSAFKVDQIRIAVQPRSLFSDVVQVQEVYIAGPEITYEIGLGKTNIGKIQDNIDAFVKTVSGPGEAEPAAPGGSTKKVTIDVARVENGKIHLGGTLIGQETLPIPLPTIEMHDIGKGSPVSGAKAAAEILNRVLGGVIDAVKQSGKEVLDAAKDVGGAVKEGGAELKKNIEGAVGGVKGLFKKGK